VSASPRIRVVIADDHPIVRLGLRAVLEHHEEIRVLAECGDLPALQGMLGRLRPDVLLLDLSMPEPALPALPALLAAAPGTAVLILTAEVDPVVARDALRAGAAGYQVKERPAAELLQAVRAVSRRQRYVDPSVGAGLVALSDYPEPPGGLTAREAEVLALIAAGHTNREVGERLFLSTRTVESHRARIQLKLNIRSRAELVAYAERHGLRAHDPSG